MIHFDALQKLSIRIHKCATTNVLKTKQEIVLRQWSKSTLVESRKILSWKYYSVNKRLVNTVSEVFGRDLNRRVNYK